MLLDFHMLGFGFTCFIPLGGVGLAIVLCGTF